MEKYVSKDTIKERFSVHYMDFTVHNILAETEEEAIEKANKFLLKEYGICNSLFKYVEIMTL